MINKDFLPITLFFSLSSAARPSYLSIHFLSGLFARPFCLSIFACSFVCPACLPNRLPFFPSPPVFLSVSLSLPCAQSAPACAPAYPSSRVSQCCSFLCAHLPSCSLALASHLLASLSDLLLRTSGMPEDAPDSRACPVEYRSVVLAQFILPEGPSQRTIKDPHSGRL